MVKHYIIMSSSYTDGTRVAMDITEDKLLNSESIGKIIQEIKDGCDQDVPISTHFIETESETWESVVAYDSFFDGVKHIATASDFSKAISKGRVLSGLEVATYILSKVRCTHLSLEKLVYFAYADYLCKFSKRLFEDKIYAFTHGPVVESVYETYKRSGYKYIDPPKQEYDPALEIEVTEAPAKSRILFAKDGPEKLCSIDSTIETYGELSAGELVDLTHKKGSPWSRVDSTKQYQVISDDLIKQYHHVEEIGS